jgi:ferrochelatase
MSVAVLLVSHGTVENLDDLGAFVTNVRRGHAPPQELLSELRRRYEAVGGSPLNTINGEVARKLAARLGIRVAVANRLWDPYPRDVLAAFAREGVTRAALVPLAPYSAPIYAADAKPAADAAGIALACAANWGQNRKLRDAFAARIASALALGGPREALMPTSVVMTAHSLPRAVIDAGDPYEREVRAAADAIAAAVSARFGDPPHFIIAFQSQGFAGTGRDGRPLPWLGPDLGTALDEAKARGSLRVVFAPVGFLADHVEILYDLDLEARKMAADRGLMYARAQSLNADDDFVEALAEVTTAALASPVGAVAPFLLESP